MDFPAEYNLAEHTSDRLINAKNIKEREMQSSMMKPAVWLGKAARSSAVA